MKTLTLAGTVELAKFLQLAAAFNAPGGKPYTLAEALEGFCATNPDAFEEGAHAPRELERLHNSVGTLKTTLGCVCDAVEAAGLDRDGDPSEQVRELTEQRDAARKQARALDVANHALEHARTQQEQQQYDGPELFEDVATDAEADFAADAATADHLAAQERGTLVDGARAYAH